MIDKIYQWADMQEQIKEARCYARHHNLELLDYLLAMAITEMQSLESAEIFDLSANLELLKEG